MAPPFCHHATCQPQGCRLSLFSLHDLIPPVRVVWSQKEYQQVCWGTAWLTNPPSPSQRSL
eukprot:12886796-Prorocentrum_lima.AAC.1